MRDPPAAGRAQHRAARIFAACALALAGGLLAQAGAQLKWVAGVALHRQPGFWSVVALAGMAVFALLMLVQRSAPAADFAPDIDESATQPAAPSTAQDSTPSPSPSPTPSPSPSPSPTPSPSSSPAQVRPWQAWFGALEYAGYFLLYVAAVPRLGYLPATLLALPLLTWRLGYRAPRMLIISALFGVTVVVLFKSLLQVKIPGGSVYELLPAAARNFMILYL